ncbi:unnamed protein product [Rhodiola kirilowii]
MSMRLFKSSIHHLCSTVLHHLVGRLSRHLIEDKLVYILPSPFLVNSSTDDGIPNVFVCLTLPYHDIRPA